MDATISAQNKVQDTQSSLNEEVRQLSLSNLFFKGFQADLPSLLNKAGLKVEKDPVAGTRLVPVDVTETTGTKGASVKPKTRAQFVAADLALPPPKPLTPTVTKELADGAASFAHNVGRVLDNVIQAQKNRLANLYGDSLVAEMLKLQVTDPGNNAEVRNNLTETASELRKIAIKEAQALNNKAAEALKNAQKWSDIAGVVGKIVMVGGIVMSIVTIVGTAGAAAPAIAAGAVAANAATQGMVQVTTQAATQVATQTAIQLARETGKRAAEEACKALINEMGKEAIQKMGQEGLSHLIRQMSHEMARNMAQQMATQLPQQAAEQVTKQVIGQVAKEFETAFAKELATQLSQTVGGQITQAAVEQAVSNGFGQTFTNYFSGLLENSAMAMLQDRIISFVTWKASMPFKLRMIGFGTTLGFTAVNASVQWTAKQKSTLVEEIKNQVKKQQLQQEMHQEQIEEENEIVKVMMEAKNQIVDHVLKIRSGWQAIKTSIQSIAKC